MNLPLITILIANHNNEEYLGGCIDSALLQDYAGPIIVAVIDNGSTDGSWDVVEEKLLKDIPGGKIKREEENGMLVVRADTLNNFSYLCIKTDEALGPSEARNVAIELTDHQSYAYVVLDADDEMYPHKISTLFTKYIEDPHKIGVVYADYDVLHTDTGKIIREYKEPFDRRRLMEECIIHSGSLINSEALIAVKEETGYYDRTMRVCEDYDLWMRITDRYLAAHIPESLTLVRVTGDNSSSSVKQKTWEKNWQRVMEKAQQRQNAQTH